MVACSKGRKLKILVPLDEPTVPQRGSSASVELIGTLREGIVNMDRHMN
jgi:RAB protein geranylgeranyltransferase component A